MHLQRGLAGICPHLNSPRALGLFNIGTVHASHCRRVDKGLYPIQTFQDKGLFLGLGLLGGDLQRTQEQNDHYRKPIHCFTFLPFYFLPFYLFTF